MVAFERSGAAVGQSRTEANVGQGERIVSAAAGGLLAWAGLRMLVRRPLLGLSAAALGGYLVQRGARGHCALYQSLGARPEDAGTLSNPFTRELRSMHSLAVLGSPDELYRFWRDRENIKRFVPMVERVDVPDERHLHFVAYDPDSGERIEWDSEIIEDRPGELIAWRSTGQTAFSGGQVAFCPAGGERGTIVRLEMRYRPPGGVFGAAIAKLRGRSLDGRAREYLRRFKELVEAGEVATSAGPSGPREKQAAPTTERRVAAPCAAAGERRADVVEEASQESFPASDAPAWS